jgi:hypothetical protein
MLDSIVELLGALSFCALTVLIGTCILGSIVAALRAVSRGSVTMSTKHQGSLLTGWKDIHRD